MLKFFAILYPNMPRLINKSLLKTLKNTMHMKHQARAFNRHERENHQFLFNWRRPHTRPYAIKLSRMSTTRQLKQCDVTCMRSSRVVVQRDGKTASL